MIDNQKYSIILPGRIIEYFEKTQTATIQISVETIYSSAESSLLTKKREPLEDVPVQTPSGGGWAITMPIEKGDTCILFFSQVGYDHWLYEDKDTAGLLANLPKPWLRRQFSDDDGFALVGLNTIPRAIKNYTNDGSQWRNQDATQYISLKKDLSIVLNSPTSISINAPKVYVNCEIAEIKSSKSVTIDTPSTIITGTLDVGGATKLANTLDVTGGLTAEGDIVSGGISVTKHIHNVLSADFGTTSKPS